MTVTNNFTLV